MYVHKVINIYIDSHMHIKCSKFFHVPKFHTIEYYRQEGSGRKAPRILNLMLMEITEILSNLQN
jgi:hypothetical protein